MNDSRSQNAFHAGQGAAEAAQGMDERPGGMAGTGTGGHAGGLTDQGDVRVVVEDLERDALGEQSRIIADEDDAAAGAQSGPPDENGQPVDVNATGGDELGQPAAAKPQRFIESRFTVEHEFDGWRLDRYLKHRIPRLSRTRIQRIIELQLTIDGRAAKPSTTLHTGTGILIRRPARPEPAVPRDFRVISDDGDVLAIDKPAGLPMHPTARYHFNTLTTLLRERYPGEPLQIAHRLDRETSGLVLVARGPLAARGLKMAFAGRRVHKRYLALVQGELRDGLGTIDLPLRLSDGPLKIKMLVDARGLPSRTRYRIVERLRGHTLVECRPETGRQHQIRAHLAAIGHPIVGDKLYGESDQLFLDFCDGGWSDELAARLGLPRQALHAFEATFPHPRTGAATTITAPLAEDIAAYLAPLR